MRSRSVAALFSIMLTCGVAASFRVESQGVRSPSRFVPGDAGVAPAVKDQTTPSLCQGGDKVLAVWADNRANDTGGYEGETSWDIYGMRFDAAGNGLDAVPFAIAAGNASQKRPRTAWNGTNWLVVFESVDFNGTGYYVTSLEALRVAPDGHVLDPKPIKLFNMTPVGGSWAVASDGSEWVVVNESTAVNADIVAARISSAGALLDPGPRRIVAETYYLRGASQLAYASGVFLLAYENRAVRFDSGLNLLDAAPIPLATVPIEKLVSNGSGFYAVWNQQLPDFSMALFGSRIDKNGRLLDGGGSGVNISGPNPPGGYATTSVAWDGTQWKVTWGSLTETRLARVSAAGSVLDPGGVLIAGQKTGTSASAGNGTLQIAWSDFIYAGPSGSYEVFSNQIDAGNNAGPTRTISSGAPAQMRVDIATSGSGYMMVYRSSTGPQSRVLAQPLDAVGNPLTAEPVELDTSTDSVNYPGYPAVAWNGSLYMVVWNNPSGVVVRRVRPNGTPIDATPIVVMTSSFGPADVEALGGDFLVVGLRCGINCQIIYPVAARVRGSDGIVLDATPIAMSGTYCSSPKLAVLGGRWLLVWQAAYTHDSCIADTLGTFIDAGGTKVTDFMIERSYSLCGGNGLFSLGLASSGSVGLVAQSRELTSGTETDLLMHLIDPDGTVHPYVNLTPWKDDQYHPNVTWDGSSFVLVYQDQKADLGGDWSLEPIDARSDLIGMRITPSGTILDPQGFIVANGPSGETYPNAVASGHETLIAGSFVRNNATLVSYRIGYELFGTGGNQWPVAVAAASPTGGDVPLWVTFSSNGSTDLDGTVTAYLWDFGDGTTSPEANPTHLYTVGGPHLATLTVTDNRGAKTMQEVLISALERNLVPVAISSSSVTSGPMPLDVTFYAAGTYDPDGFVGNLHWAFSDGAESWGGSAFHTFYEQGTYQVILEAYDRRGGVGSATPITITVGPPLAPLAPSNLSAIAFSPDWINLSWTDNSNNEEGFKVERCQGAASFCDTHPASWAQIAQTGRNVNWYGDTGLPASTTYSYRVRAFNVTAHSAYSSTATATTPSYQPVAVIVPSVLGGPVPLPVRFDGSGSHDPDGTIVSWSWDFGDGSTGSGPIVDHTFTTAGWVYVKLSVTDNAGLTADEYQSINVTTDGADAPATSDESNTYGTIVSGSYLNTTTQDDSAEVLREANVSSTSRLEHTWTLSVAPGRDQTFQIDAFHSTNSEGDNFIFEYSQNKLSWTAMVTVTKTADNDQLQSYKFTQDVTGLIYVRVRDLDRTTGKTKLDTVSIDQMYVSSKSSMGYTGEVAPAGAVQASGLLQISKSYGTVLQLQWGASCISSDKDYAVYEGPIGNFRAHLPIRCSTGGSTNTTITPSDGNRYYLVVPNDLYYEGRYGSSSSGAPIPAGPTRCLPVAQTTGCP